MSGGTTRIKAAFYRGGTSKAVMFRGVDLPGGHAARDRMFLHVLGSPDPYGRQLDGLGGGLSSLSKAVIVEPSPRPDADLDYTFVQIAVREPVADYGSTCGNMSAAVGPFAVDEGLVRVRDGEAALTVHNTNTGKLFRTRFPVAGGRAVEAGDFAMPGVPGTGARVTLDYLDPGGAATGRLLPTGHAQDRLEVPGVGVLDASLVDAANPVVFIRARDAGIAGTEPPEALDADAALMDRLERIRRAAAVAMGLAATPGAAPRSNPKIAVVAPPAPFTALDGTAYDPGTMDLTCRLVSMGNMHRAVTLTGAMCAAVAARIEGTLLAPFAASTGPLRIGNPSGILPISADVRAGPEGWHAVSATTYRTQRRLMEGAVLVPAELLEPAEARA